MAERLKRAAAWLGLVTDDRYADEQGEEVTEGLTREELLGVTSGAVPQPPLSIGRRSRPRRRR